MATNTIRGVVQPDIARPGFFEFSLDGMATARQMERLIELSSDMAKRLVRDKNSPEGQAELRRIEAIKASTAETIDATKETKTLSDATRDLSYDFNNLERVATGSIKGLSGLSYFLGSNSKLAVGITGFGTMLGALNGYADSLGKAMQMGVAGNIMTFAIASKTAGLRLESFTKALSETGGGFASLGSNATDGAIGFGKLVNEVRVGTERFGNLGLSIDELAVFTAQQVKTAVGQGFKGRQAQEQVRQNSIALAKNLQSLSESTGKSVTELAAAANKLATDPLIATMVATTRENREQVSKAVNSFGASIRGVFGEAGDALGTDALKAAAAGLPLALTETGKNLLIASTPLYNEFTRLAQGVQQGREVTEQDRDRLRKIAEREVEARGQQIKTLAMLEGPAGDAARQILKLAQEARFYNTEEGKERRKQIDAARKFVAERNKLEANLQQALVPLLQLLNSVNWNLFYEVLNAATTVLTGFLHALNPIAKVLSATGAGSLIGGLLALAGVIGIAKAAFAAFIGIRNAIGSIIPGGGAGAAAGIFSRRANGQTALTPLWVKSVDAFTSGMGPLNATRQTARTARERARDAYRNSIGRMSTAGKLAAGGLLVGGLVGLGGDAMGGDSGAMLNLLGAGLDVASILTLYKLYGSKGAVQIGKMAQRMGVVTAPGLRGLMGGVRLGSTVMKGGVGGIIGGTATQTILGQPETTAGSFGSIGGAVGGGIIGGSLAGRFLGGFLGAWAGPIGIAVGSAIGGIAGQVIGDYLFGEKVKDTAVSANDEIYNSRVKQANETAQMSSKMAELIDLQRASNNINAQAAVYQRDTSRGVRNLAPVQ